MHAIMRLATAAFTIAIAELPERVIAQVGATAHFRIIGVSIEPNQSTRNFQVVSSGDADGDGRAEIGVLKVFCVDGKVSTATFRYHEWRWNNSTLRLGQKPPPELGMTWDASSPAMQQVKLVYDLRKGKDAPPPGKSEPPSEWREISLSNAAFLCGDAPPAEAE